VTLEDVKCKLKSEEGMKSRGGNPKELAAVMSGLRLPATVKDHLAHSEVWTRWIEIVGPELSKVTSPLELKARTLVVNVVHQAWAQQLHFLKTSLLAKIRLICESAKITDIQFRVGKVIDPRLWEGAGGSGARPKNTQPLSERQEMTLRAVDDPDLRASIRKAMQAWRGSSQ
jgi:hypothetical protein